MTNLLETLLQGAVERDERPPLAISRRPYPASARQLFDLFAAMGATASVGALTRGLEQRQADPRLATFAMLGRWPTAEELAAVPDPYVPGQHVRSLLRSQEFRRGLAARMLAAFPEKRRLLFVRLPRCAGQTTLEQLEALHPMPPTGVGGGNAALMPRIGICAARFDTTTTLSAWAPRMAAFVTPGGMAPGEADDNLHWQGAEPAFRPGDLLFAILRPPRDLACSQVNAALADLQAGESPALRQRVGTLPPAGNVAAWRALGRDLLGDIVTRNPVCHALGDGTAAGALAACRCVPISLVSLGRFDEWARVAIGPVAAVKRIASEPILRREDVADVAAEFVAEDEALYARFEAAMVGNSLPYVLGSAL